MTLSNSIQQIPQSLTNRIVQGDCIEIMRELPAGSVDFILTDPPYLVNFRDQYGRSLKNDVNDHWLLPAFTEAYRVLKQDHFMLCFYGWPRAHKFLEAWIAAGFCVVGHLVFLKRYASKTRFLRYQHEQAYLLAKGRPALPECAISDVQKLEYTGNALHPTQKSVMSLVPLVRAFSRPSDLVLDCFCGSASACGAAMLTGRRFLGIELDEEYAKVANARIDRIRARMIAKASSSAISVPATRFLPAGDCARTSSAPQDMLRSA